MLRLISKFVSLLVMIAVLAGCNQSSPTDQQSENQTATPVAIPENLKFTVHDLDGNPVASESWFTGGAVVVNIWGTWCRPCRTEVPALAQLHKDFAGSRLKLVSISSGDTPEQVKNFAAEFRMEWEQTMATDEALEQLNFGGAYPTTIFFAPDGTELGRLVGSRSYEVFYPTFALLANSTN